MWNGKKVTLVFPAYNEGKNIKNAVEDFAKTGYFDEIIVVNNNSTDNTEEEAKKTSARVVREEKQGYGYTLRRGMASATGDYIVLAEPDGTFSGKDSLKLLVYSDDFDVVQGTRTSKDLILQGANMGLFLKWGNWFVGKMLEFLFNGPSLTDVGCTMRLIKRDVYEKIKNKLTVGVSHFLPELTILCILSGAKIVEISLNYGNRIGESKITGKKIKAFKVGMNMILLILSYRIRSIFSKRMV